VDGFCDVLHDEKDALLLEVNDYAGMAEAVRLLIRSPDIAKCLVAAGHLNAARFRIERTAELYSNLYRELLAAGHET
jgi:glycosyltransferase involved in cell wall biosynthesis